MPCFPPINVVSISTVFPDRKSTLGDLKLSVADLPMLSCHYIQKGCLFTRPPQNIPIPSLLSLLKQGLSSTLSLFPPLAGRLTTDQDGYVFLTCNDAGADFIYANAGEVFIRDILGPAHVPEQVREFFAFDGKVSYEGHFGPILAVQVTELADGFFIGCAANHAVMDGTSFWNFFNTFAAACRGFKKISLPSPDFTRDSVLISKAVLKLPDGGPQVTFSNDKPLRERIFSVSREAVLKLKDRTNNRYNRNYINAAENDIEILGKQSNDTYTQSDNNKVASIIESWLKNGVVSKKATQEISSFQSLCALLWRAVTRARKLPASKTTTFRMAVNCRHRLEPRLDPYYFGNAIQSVPTCTSAGEVLSRDLRWCAEQLNKSVMRTITLTCAASWRIGREARGVFLWGTPMARRSRWEARRGSRCMTTTSAGEGRWRSGAGRRTSSTVRSRRSRAGREAVPSISRWFWRRRPWQRWRTIRSSCTTCWVKIWSGNF